MNGFYSAKIEVFFHISISYIKKDTSGYCLTSYKSVNLHTKKFK